MREAARTRRAGLGIDLTQVDLNLLVVFEAVFRQGHVGKAAALLHVSSSAVSHGLGRLRELFDDPLFLKTPKGVVPSARALELASAITDILARVRGVVGGVEAFDARASMRRFTIGTSDATAAVMLPRLLASLRHTAPRIDLSVCNLLPQNGLAELESRAVDLAVLPLREIPARFFSKVIAEEDFVIAARCDHPFLKVPSLRRFCEMQHMLVSITGDAHGYVDGELEKHGLSRRVAVTVPNFMLALAALADSELLAAVPKSLVDVHAARFGVASVKAPLALRRFQMHAVVLKPAMQDAGVAWLFEAVEATFQPASRASSVERSVSRRAGDVGHRQRRTSGRSPAP